MVKRTNKYPVYHTPPPYRGHDCPHCLQRVNPFQTNESDAVCPECGCVLEEVLLYGVAYTPRALKSTYNRVFHWNERMACFQIIEPPVEDDIFELFEAEAWTGKYGHPSDYGYHHVAEVLRSVIVPPWMQEKYRSRKFMMKPMTNLKRYRERWLQLLWKLTGVRPVDPPHWLIVALTTYFKGLQVPWNVFNNPALGIGRHNFINYNLIIIIGLERLGAEEYKQFFPMIRGKKKLTELCGQIRRMFEWLGWAPTETLLDWTEPERKRPALLRSGLAGIRRGRKRTRTLPAGRPRRCRPSSACRPRRTRSSSEPLLLELLCENLLSGRMGTAGPEACPPPPPQPPGKSCAQEHLDEYSYLEGLLFSELPCLLEI